MKTILPESISAVEEAKQFLTQLHNNAEAYHPEDDAHDILWNMRKAQRPTSEECDRLNKLMDDIYKLEGNFDACSFLLELNGYWQGHFSGEEAPEPPERHDIDTREAELRFRERQLGNYD